jgi:hypothetical protein
MFMDQCGAQLIRPDGSVYRHDGSFSFLQADEEWGESGEKK